VTRSAEPPADPAEELFEDLPCGHLAARPDGTIVRVNRTFETLTGLAREQLVDKRRFQDVLAPGGRIYYETHYAPLLHMQGFVRAIALEIVRADGTRLPALVNSVLRRDAGGNPVAVWTSVFDATDRRGYEDELLSVSRREHEIALKLQRSMLDGALSAPEGCELDVIYRAGMSGMEVGGDWYDAFWLGDGERIGLVVGDVVGRGLEAAAAMGQLRSAVRALASTGLPPAALLERMDEYPRRYGIGKMCTLVYAELAPADGLLRFGCAGHPPPLVAEPGEPPRFLWGGRSTPLDAFSAGTSREQATEQLKPGGMVLLYTDGLVEQRTRPVDEGMELLRSGVAARIGDPLPAVLRHAIDAASESEHSDDVCALAARIGA
jgi:phosphoserine phosphatase RsbU/P